MNDGFQNISGLLPYLFFLFGFLLRFPLGYFFLFCCFFLSHTYTSMKKRCYVRAHLLSPFFVYILITRYVCFNKNNRWLSDCWQIAYSSEIFNSRIHKHVIAGSACRRSDSPSQARIRPGHPHDTLYDRHHSTT
jgi:hypothetical protein